MKPVCCAAAVLFFLLPCSVPPTWAASQSRSAKKSAGPAAYKLQSVTASGTTRYTSQEILTASGLEPGQNAAEADFKEAAHHLGSSGMFTEVAYSFSYSDADIKVDFQLSDIDKSKLVPAHFENFVWFTDSELFTALKQRVSLFAGELPLSGSLPDRVQKALQQLLDEKHIPARVSYLHEVPQEGGKVLGIAYSVESIDIRVRNVVFPGATPDLEPGLEAAARRLQGAPYRRSGLASVAKVDFLPVCLKNGYLKASFGDTSARIVSQAEGEVEVDAIVPVTPSKQYSVSEVSWNGNSAVPNEETARLIHLAIGKPADAVRLSSDLESLIKLYRNRGYMTAKITPDAQMDDEKSTVHYVINVSEGDLYKMGELEILGVDTASKDRLLAAWTLREGQPYNAGYARKFIEDAPRLLPRELRYLTTIDEALDAKDKTVDVTIHFKPQ